jgi:signal transduction histidine kinase
MDIPEGHATAVFRIFQEILTNVARHAQATRVVICLTSEEGNLVLEAEDDGVGIKESDIADPKSLGLLGMQERAEILGGTVTFKRNDEQGTTVTIQIPLPATSLRELPPFWAESEASESAA